MLIRLIDVGKIGRGVNDDDACPRSTGTTCPGEGPKGILAVVGLAARADTGDPEQGFALAFDDAVPFLGTPCREGSQH